MTDLAPDALPLGPDGNVDENGAGVEHVTEQADFPAGNTKTLDANLPAGSYVVICNLPGHYKQGMRQAFTVR